MERNSGSGNHGCSCDLPHIGQCQRKTRPPSRHTYGLNRDQVSARDVGQEMVIDRQENHTLLSSKSTKAPEMWFKQTA